MILLDTDVISELMRPAIAPAVTIYLQPHDPETLFLTSLSEAEIRYGIASLPRGRRRDTLATNFQTLLVEGFTDRVIAFNRACATAYATVRTRRESAGLPISIPDAMIAATSLAHGATVATRNVTYFTQCGIAVANPWDGA
ncbi:MAG: type II toxin-antitoxin system VapC family toxin [Proteobacteria bacterium]|nr:type II toxin-antitoxin system VapC family toxin [Pseudomonadota bacterium]